MHVLWGVLFFFCVGLAVAGVALLATGVRDALRARRSRAWPTVSGTVVAAEEMHHRADVAREHLPRARYEARVHYEYTVDRPRSGIATVSLEREPTAGPERARAALARYRPGQAVAVGYNPRNPADAVLEPGVHAFRPTRVLVGVAMLVASVLPFLARWLFVGS